jgi:hypothetical protein
MEYTLEEDIKNLLVFDFKIFDLKDLVTDSDFDTYISLYGNDTLIQKLKQIDPKDFREKFGKLLNSYDIADFIIDYSIENELYIDIYKEYQNDIKVDPVDTIVNSLYVNDKPKIHPMVLKFDYDNFENNKEQFNLLSEKLFEEANKLNSKIIYYDDIIIDFLKSDILNVLSEDDNLVVKHGKYVLKIYSPNETTNTDKFNQHINEAFVGLFGLNALRNIGIINFALIYDIVFLKDCHKLQEIKSYSDCNYVLYEYIEGVTLREFMISSDVPIMVCVIRQIMYALYEANITSDFTHYDLHDDNIVIKHERVNIEYPNLKKKIGCDYRAVIIDYGSSHITLITKSGEKADFGRIFPEGNIENEVFWIHDVFKILFFMYFHTSSMYIETLKKYQEEYTEKLKLYEKNEIGVNLINGYIKQLITFFVGTDILLDNNWFDLYDEANPYYAVRKTTKFKNLKFIDFINFMDELSADYI